MAERERERDRQREAEEKTAVAGGDIQRRACTRREKERDRMREYSAQPTRSRFSASSDGRTGNPFRRLPYRPPIPTTGSAVYSESPSAHPTRDSPLDQDANGGAARTAEHDRRRDDDDERGRSFVVKRYRSAQGFKRLLYEYTRGGGINGVAPLSCRRRRCVFARRIISVVVVTRGVGAGASSTMHGRRDDTALYRRVGRA